MQRDRKYHCSILMAPDTGAGDGVDGSGDDFAGSGFEHRPTDTLDYEEAHGPPPTKESAEQAFDWEDSPASGFSKPSSETTAPASDQDISGTDETPSGTPPSGIDPATMQLAEEVGIDRSRAEALHKAGLLTDMIRSAIQRESAAPVTKPEPAAQPQPAPEQEPFKLEFDRDQFEPEVVALMDKFQGALDHYHGQIATLQKQNADLQSGIQAQRMTQFEADFDRQLAGLGPESKKLLGEGPTKDMDRYSPEYQRRNKIERAYLQMMVGASDLGYDVNSEDMFTIAAHGVLSHNANQLARRELNEAVQNRAKQHVQVPTRRESVGPGASPEQRATQKVAEMLRAKGETAVEEYV